MLRFCKFCWRHVRTTSVCATHAVHANPEAAAEYKLVQRLRPSFEREVLALATREELEFHDSGFVAPVLFSCVEPLPWLRSRRPHLAQVAITSDHDVVPQLVMHLHGSEELGVTYATHPHMLTIVTLRAEAWLRARAARAAWGGRRAGSGTKAKSHSD